MRSSGHEPRSINQDLILSVFPGIDLLGRAFEEQGFCVVRGPDSITGGDVRRFTPAAGHFAGIIAGPPCQDFSSLNRNPGPYGLLMLSELVRIIEQTRPAWFLIENVARLPALQINDYYQQRFNLDLAWFTEFSRLRHFVFGSRCGRLLDPINDHACNSRGGAVTGSDTRSFRTCCDIQGLEAEYDLPWFTLTAKKQAVANGVPMALGRYLAGLIATEFYDQPTYSAIEHTLRRCLCGCGRIVTGRQRYAGAACRKRAQRARDRLTA